MLRYSIIIIKSYSSNAKVYEPSLDDEQRKLRDLNKELVNIT